MIVKRESNGGHQIPKNFVTAFEIVVEARQDWQECRFYPDTDDEVHGHDNKDWNKHQSRCLLSAYPIRTNTLGLQGWFTKSSSTASGCNPLIESGKIISRCAPQSKQLEAWIMVKTPFSYQRSAWLLPIWLSGSWCSNEIARIILTHEIMTMTPDPGFRSILLYASRVLSISETSSLGLSHTRYGAITS